MWNLKRARGVELTVRHERFRNFVFDLIKYIKEKEEEEKSGQNHQGLPCSVKSRSLLSSFSPLSPLPWHASPRGSLAHGEK